MSFVCIYYHVMLIFFFFFLKLCNSLCGICVSNCTVYSGLFVVLSGPMPEIVTQDDGAGLCISYCDLPCVSILNVCAFVFVSPSPKWLSFHLGVKKTYKSRYL